MIIDEQYKSDTVIASLWYGLDYGSILSAYALYSAIENCGRHPVLLGKPKGLWNERYEDENNIAGKFILQKCYVFPQVDDKEKMGELMHSNSSFVTGAEIVWNYNVCGKDADGFFFLADVPTEKTKIAYAASFGGKNQLDSRHMVQSRNWLKRFQAVAADDIQTINSLEMSYHLDAEWHIPPIFLLDDYSSMVDTNNQESYIFAYMDNCDRQKQKMIDIASVCRSLQVRCLANPNDYENSASKFDSEVQPIADVEQWISIMNGSELVITDSYAAMCMAIALNKQFIMLAPKNVSNIQQIENLLDKLGLMERLVYVGEDMKEYAFLCRKPIKYSLVNEKLNIYRVEAFEWFKRNLAVSE